MALSKAAAYERGRIAGLSRDREPDDPELVEARRNLRAERLAERVHEAVSQAPPLTREQIDRIAAILNGGQSDPIEVA